jgi:hypothetical protein
MAQTKAPAGLPHLLFSSVSTTRLAPFTMYFLKSRLPALLTKVATFALYFALYTLTRTAFAALDTARLHVSGSALIVRAAAEQWASLQPSRTAASAAHQGLYAHGYMAVVQGVASATPNEDK